MVVLKFLKVPTLLALLIVFFPSSIFSMEDEAIEHKFSARLSELVAQEVNRLEDVVVRLRTENLTLLRAIQERHSFFDSIFSAAANRNSRDFELIQAEYRFKKGEISQDVLTAVQQKVSAPVIFDSLPADLDPVLRGGISPGIPALSTSVSVTALAAQADAALAPDHTRSTAHRRMSLGTVSQSTIRSNAADIADLSSGIEKLFLEDDDGTVIKKLIKTAK